MRVVGIKTKKISSTKAVLIVKFISPPSLKNVQMTTRGMIAAFDSMLGNTIFDASQASSDDFETSEQNPFGDECQLRSSRDPVGYSKGAPDFKHHGQAMRSAMNAEWIKSQTSEMDGLWRRGVFQKVLRSSLTPQDRAFTSRFHHKIRPKGRELISVKYT